MQNNKHTGKGLPILLLALSVLFAIAFGAARTQWLSGAAWATGYTAGGGVIDPTNNQGAIAIGGTSDTPPNAENQAHATANGATAIGSGANASGLSATAIGIGAKASGQQSGAFGNSAESIGAFSTAIGTYSVVSYDYGVALGYSARSTSTDAIAIGDKAVASGPASIAQGKEASASSANGIALGMKAQATNGTGNVAIGNEAKATAVNTDALAAGTRAEASGDNSIAIGRDAHAYANQGVAIGKSAHALSSQSIAIGELAEATNGTSNIAIGTGANATAANYDAIAFGVNSKAEKNRAIAIGAYSDAAMDDSLAVMRDSKAQGLQSMAIGLGSTASGDNSIAQGTGAKVNLGASNGIAIGINAVSAYANSVALGSNSATAAAAPTSSATINGRTYTFATAGAANNPASVVSIGSTTATRQLTNVANGQVGQNSTDAINGSQLYAVASDLGQGTKFAADSYSGSATQNSHNAVPGTTVNIVGGNGSGTYSASNIKTYVTNDVTSGDGTVSIQMSTTPTFSSVTATNGTNTVVVDGAAGIITGLTNKTWTGTPVTGRAATEDQLGVLSSDITNITNGTMQLDYVKSNKTTTSVAADASGTDSTALGYSSQATGGESVAVGNTAKAGDLATAVGYGSAASSNGSTAVGIQTSASNQFSFAAGYQAKASGQSSEAIGDNSQSSAMGSTALGSYSNASADGAVALGPNSAASGITSIAEGYLSQALKESSIALGTSSIASEDKAIALGANAKAQNANSVALGSDSETAASVPTSTATINGKTYTFTTTGAANAPTSVVSIGSTTATRQLTNVANGQVGQNSTDAINGSQLYAVASDLGQGTKFAADSYSGTATQNNHNAVPGTTVNIVGGNGSGTYSASNIKTYVTNDVTSGDGTVSIQMSTTPTFDSVTAGTGANQVITGSDGVKVGGNTYITGSGLNANSQKVTNVANGTAANDAVNFSQLTAAAASQTASDKHVLAGSYAVNTTTNSVSLPIVSGDELSSSVNAVITDVASAAKLNIVSGDVTNIKNNITNLTDNGITTAGNDGTATLPLGKKLTVKGTATTAGTYSSSNIKTVQTTGADGNTIEVQIADNPEFTSVTAGTGANQVITGSDGVKVGGNTYITGSGLNANSQKVTNVANGTADSDAVNLSQLKASAAGSTTKLENGKNTTVSYTTATDGSKTYKVDLNDDITMGTGTNAVAISGTNGTIKTGTVTIAGGSTNTVTGLSNKTWDGTTITSGRSATEDQLKLAQAAAVAAAGKADTHVKAGTYTPTNGTVAMDIVNNEGTATGEQVKITDIASKTQQDTNTTNIAKNTTNITNLTNKVDSGWTAQVNGTDVKTVTPTSSKLNFTAGDNIVLANDGGSIKITSTGGTDSAAVHYDKDTSGNVDKTNLTLGDGSKPTTIKNVAAGTIAKGSTEAVNGGQLYDTNQRIDNAYTQIGALGSEIEKVGAKAAALSGLHPLDYDPSYKWDFTAAFGGYRSEQAAALGVFYHADENTLFNAAVTVGNSENLYRFGVSMRLGPDSKHHSITSREALIKQVKNLTEENKNLNGRVDELSRQNQELGEKMETMMKLIEEQQKMKKH